LKFLKGAELTRKIQSMLKSNDRADIAIAYWGGDALKLLKVKPGRRNVRVVCCLKGGKSDPEVIAKFKKRARQHDKLHAKVIWTPRGAIVGSANASSNGLPQEDLEAAGLIEAGIYLEDRATLDEIQSWFQNLFSVRAKAIKASDLQEARLARLLAPKTGGSSKKRSSKKSLLELAKAVLASKIDEPITFTIYCEPTSRSTNKSAKDHIANNSKEMQRALKIERRDLHNLDWYTNWPNLPKSSFLIDCHFKNGLIGEPHVVQTFHSTKAIRVKTNEGFENFHFVLDRGVSGFNFRVTKEDAKAIRACSRQLWSKASGDNEGRCIDLKKAAPILLGFSKR
jgi:hypothetical protein